MEGGIVADAERSEVNPHTLVVAQGLTLYCDHIVTTFVRKKSATV
jgi:hypothetical protein